MLICPSVIQKKNKNPPTVHACRLPISGCLSYVYIHAMYHVKVHADTLCRHEKLSHQCVLLIYIPVIYATTLALRARVATLTLNMHACHNIIVRLVIMHSNVPCTRRATSKLNAKETNCLGTREKKGMYTYVRMYMYVYTCGCWITCLQACDILFCFLIMHCALQFDQLLCVYLINVMLICLPHQFYCNL